MNEWVQLPDSFVAWQCAARRQLFDDLHKGRVPGFLPAHLPVVSTLEAPGAAFPLRSANKGVGLLPTPDHLLAYLDRIWACLDRCGEVHDASNLPDRIAAARALYDAPAHVDRTVLGTIEIFRGGTYANLQRDPRAAVLFTGIGPRYVSWQLDCAVEIIDAADPRFRFLHGMRMLFEQERFHIQQPGFTVGYLLDVVAVHDKAPHRVGEPR